MSNGKAALVTGATGFTGWHMVNLLLERGYDVVATDFREPKDEIYKQTKFIVADLADPAEVFSDEFLAAIAELQYVFHIAGLFDHSKSLSRLFEVNVLGTRNFLTAVERSCPSFPRVVVWGAAGIFGDFSHIPLPASEEMLPKTDNPYFLSKWHQELEALRFWHESGIPVTIIRPSAVYGPRSVYGMALSITTLLKTKLAFVIGNGRNKGALVHVRDVVRAAEFLANDYRAIGEVYHVTDDTPYSIEEIARCLAKACGAIFVPIKIPKWLALKFAGLLGVHRELVDVSTFNSWISNEKLTALGFEFEYPDGKIGLAETVEWYKSSR